MIQKNIFLWCLLLFAVYSCSNDPLDIDPKPLTAPPVFIHLDSVLFHTPEQKLSEQIENLKLRPEEILDYQLGYCLNVGPLKDTGTVKRLMLFRNDPYIKRLEAKISSKFANLANHRSQINSGFAHLKHHFPKGKLPDKVMFMNSFFASNVFCTEHEIGIGLERYLGPQTDVIKELPSQQIHQWIKEEMLETYLDRDVLTGWIMTHYVSESKEHLADAMIRWGKILYFTEASFPDLPKHLILRYSAKEYEWALKNEQPFWKYLVDEKLLFTDHERDMTNFLSDAPFTIGLPEKGPDRLGQFLGWRMVHQYMDEHPDTKLEDLNKLNFNTILQAYQTAD